MVQISRRDLERLAIGFGIADFLTEGRLTAPVARGTKAALKKAAPAVGRALITYGPRVAMTAARVTPGPVAAVGLGAAAYSQRERIADAAGNIYEKVAPAAQQYGAGVAERTRELISDPAGYLESIEPPGGYGIKPLPSFPSPRKKKTTPFNRAISKGMSIVKGSTSYGKKGVINNAKKAFSAVTKAASRVNRGRKAPAKGLGRKLHTAMSKILPKKKKTTKKKTKWSIQVNR